MATTYILLNQLQFAGPHGPSLLQPGKVISDALYDVVAMRAAGARLMVQSSVDPVEETAALSHIAKGWSQPVDLGSSDVFSTTEAADLNISGETAGDLLYFDGAAWVRLAIGSSANVLRVASGLPAWGALNLAGGSAAVTGALPLANLTHGTAAQILVTNSGATAPAWVTVSGDGTLSSAGVLAVTKVNGITISGTPAAGKIPIASSSSASAWTAVSGDATLSSAGVAAVVAISGQALAATPASAAYQQLTWNGTQWVGIGLVSATLTDKNSVVDCALSSAGTDGNASQFVLPAATLSTNRTLTLNTDSAVTGETITVVRLDATAHTYAVINGGAGAGTLVTLPNSAKRVATFSFDGTNWSLVAVASLS